MQIVEDRYRENTERIMWRKGIEIIATEYYSDYIHMFMKILQKSISDIEAIDTPLTTLFLLGLFLILTGIALLLNHYNIKI